MELRSVISSTKNVFATLGRALAFLLIGWAFLILCSTSNGQRDTASLSGVITDQSGAVVAGAEVRAVNLDTNVSRSTLSNASGAYVVPDLKPGHYSVQVAKDGFKKIDL